MKGLVLEDISHETAKETFTMCFTYLKELLLLDSIGTKLRKSRSRMAYDKTKFLDVLRQNWPKMQITNKKIKQRDI